MVEILPTALAERSEAETLFELATGTPEPVRDALGMESVRIGDGVVMSMRRDPTQFWSKALGFGFDAPVTADLIDEVRAFYRAQQTPVAAIQLAPSVLPKDWSDICAKAGLTPGPFVVKMACETDTAVRNAAQPASGEPGLRVAPVTEEDTAAWSTVMMRGFEMPEGQLGGDGGRHCRPRGLVPLRHLDRRRARRCGHDACA